MMEGKQRSRSPYFSGTCIQLLLLLAFLCYGISTSACIPKINWNDSISFCSGNSITLSATNANATYLWSTGATTPTQTITTSGTYWVTVTNPCGSASDTIHVSADSPMILNLGKNRTVCSSTTLSVPYNAFSSYEWQDGSKSNQFQVTQSGTYWLKLTNGCGTFRDTVQISVEQPPSPNLGPDINNCSPVVNTFNVLPPTGTSVLWSNGSTASSISVSSPGTYWVEMSNACGTFSDTVKVTLNKGQNLNLGDTVAKCQNGVAILMSNVSGGSYSWSTGATTRSITVQSPGLYWLQFTDPCGTFTDSVYVNNSGKAQVNLGPDTSVCDNVQLVLDAGYPGALHTWQDGSNKRTFKVDSGGVYWVDVDNGCGSSYDTINVSIKPVPNPKIPDTVFYCAGTGRTVDAGNWGPTTSYLWDNGYTGRTQTFNSPGSHWVEIANECDTTLKNFVTHPVQNQTLDIGKDTIICEQELELNTNLPNLGNTFDWNTGSRGKSTKVFSTGIYWVEVQNACDTLTDTIQVIFLKGPKKIAKSKVNICAGSQVTIGPPFTQETTYQWNTGDTTRTINVNQQGTYTLMAFNLCDTIYDTVDVTRVFPLNVDLGPDTTFCQPNILYLNMSNYQVDSVRWSTGSRNGGLPIFKSGTYWVKLYNACGVFSDTINVQVDLLPKRKLSNLAFCTGSSDTLSVDQSIVQSYQWNTGATSSSIVVNQSGWYKVNMTNHCGTVRDSAYVRVDQPIPNFSLGKDTIFCQGTLMLDPNISGYANYQWQDGSGGSSYQVTKSGTYYVTASNTCNAYTDTIDVLITGPPVLVLGDEVRLCNGTVLTLNAQNPGSSYAWNTGDSTQTLSIDSSGIYWVTITNDCGQLTDTVDVIVEYPMDDLNLGADTIICLGQQLTLDTKYPGAITEWSNGATTQTITVSTTGKYWVKLSNSCGSWSDSIYVEVQEVPVFSLGPDDAICAIDGYYPIAGPEGLDKYSWSNGDSTQNTVIRTPGYHWLTVSNKCFSYTDTIYLKDEYPINIDLGEDTTICFGEILVLDPGNLGYPVTWSNRRNKQAIEVTRSGTFWASASNSCGFFSDTIKVRVEHHLDESPIDTVICKGDSAVFDLEGLPYELIWDDGSRKTRRWFKEEGIYPLTIYNHCGAFSKDFIVEHQQCDCPFHIPDAFTPNGDDLNDEFRIIHQCVITTFELKIFNRWGEMVFHSQDINRSWEGNFNGKPAPMGTYNYTVQYGWKVYGVERIRERKGHLSLIR